jgi:nucleoside-diphosphate-sugar epimerase
VQDPLTTNAVDVTGTLNVVLAARDAGTRRVVMASSSSVYGRAQGLSKTEGHVPQPVSPYGVSKLAALRSFNVFGPGRIRAPGTAA